MPFRPRLSSWSAAGRRPGRSLWLSHVYPAGQWRRRGGGPRVGPGLPAAAGGAGAGLFALSTTVLGVLGAPLLAQLSRPGERVVLYSIENSLSWWGRCLAYLVGGYVPELNPGWRTPRPRAPSRCGEPSGDGGPGSDQPAPGGPAGRLAAFAGQRGAAGADVAQRRLARFLRVLIPQALLGIGPACCSTFCSCTWRSASN